MTRRWLVVAALLAIPGAALLIVRPALVRATGALSIPNTIAAQPGGNLNAALLDTNWTTVANYVNAREVTIGALAARPAAGTAGRWYLATDAAGGTLYADTGSAWTQAGQGVSGGTNWPRVASLVASNTLANPFYGRDVYAEAVALRNPSTGAVTTLTSGAWLTNDTTAAGPVANGRDQAGAFGASNWIHFYYITTGSTLATISSLTPPPTGPALPATYTSWAYIGPAYLQSTGVLRSSYQRGARVWIEATTVRTSAAGTGAEQTYTMPAGTAPPNALSVRLRLRTNGAGNTPAEMRASSGGPGILVLGEAGLGAENQSITDDFPGGAASIFFIGQAAATYSIWGNGYRVANGGE